MSAARRLLAAALGGLALAGCASKWESSEPATPTTYQLPESRVGRGVGNLKHLVILPAIYDGPTIKGPAAKNCGSPDWVKDRSALETAKFLSEKKGYRVTPREKAEEAAKAKLGGPAESYSEKLYRWQTRSEEPPGGAAAMVAKLGEAFGADGVVLLLADYTSEDLITTPLMLFGITRPGLTLRAWIFEAKTGKLAWSGKYWNLGCWASADNVFQDLENAVPDVLIR